MATATNTAVKIANRALQILGVGASGRISALTTGFTPTATTDDSKEGAAMALVYDTLRQAELRRNFWTFAIRRQVIRPVDTAASTIDQEITFPTYASGDTYDKYDIVVSSGVYYISKTAANSGNAVTDTDNWEEYWGPLKAVYYNSEKKYYRGEIIYSGSNAYYMIIDLAAGATPVDGTDYHLLDGDGLPTLADTTQQAPISGRTYAFDLPRDFLRFAPDDPQYEYTQKEWLIENKRILTDNANPIFLRYVRDEGDPAKFDPMFSEGLSGRMAIASCEELTQSSTKLSAAVAIYNQAIGEARIVNAIEAGPIHHEEDYWVAVRR